MALSETATVHGFQSANKKQAKKNASYDYAPSSGFSNGIVRSSKKIAPEQSFDTGSRRMVKNKRPVVFGAMGTAYLEGKGYFFACNSRPSSTK